MKPTSRQERLLRHTFIDFQQTSEVIKDPLIFEKAEGLYVWDLEGKRYFDAIGGVFVAVLGHRHPRVMEAIIPVVISRGVTKPKLTLADIEQMQGRLLEALSDIAVEIMEFSGLSDSTPKA